MSEALLDDFPGLQSGYILVKFLGDGVEGDRWVSYGKILKIGPDCNPDINVNDDVVFSPGSGTRMSYKGTHYTILDDDRIWKRKEPQ